MFSISQAFRRYAWALITASLMLTLSACNLSTLSESIQNVSLPSATPKPTTPTPTPTPVPVSPTPLPPVTPTPTTTPSGTPAGIETARYYVAPAGSDGNAGTLQAPFATLTKAWSMPLNPGDLIYVRGGTYTLTSQIGFIGKSGTAGKPIRIWAYPGETPVFKPVSTYPAGYATPYSWRLGIYVRGHYLHFKGFEITGFKHPNASAPVMNPFYLDNSSFVTIEKFNVHHNGGSLFFHGGDGVGDGSSEGNLVVDSDFHHNSDHHQYGQEGCTDPSNASTGCGGGNSDGLVFGYISKVGSPNIVRNCRAWLNSDDGFDSWMTENKVIWENNWSFRNGYDHVTGRAVGDGNGFKLGKTDTVTTQTCRVLKNNIAFDNREMGFDKNDCKCRMEIYNNIAFRNGHHGFLIDNAGGNISRNNIAFGNASYQSAQNADSVASHNACSGAGDSCGGNGPAWSIAVSSNDFESTSAVGTDADRVDGQMPNLNFLKLKALSPLVNAGVSVGTAYCGTKPDLGAYELCPSSSKSLSGK